LNDVEVSRLLKTIAMYYPNFKIIDLDETIDAWTMVLQEYDLYTVLENLADYVKSGNTFPPVLANLLKVSENHGSRYIPSGEETQLLLQGYGEKQVSTKEVQEQALAKIKALAEGFVNKHE
jgi:hypothetical protein